MLWVPNKGKLRIQHNTGAVGAATIGTTVTTGAAATTKGAVAQLIASTSFDAYWITVMASGYALAATTSHGTVDILIGTATEEILIPDLLMGYCGGALGGKGPKVWHFPIYIPAGSRISAQACGARVSTALQIAVFLYGGMMPAFRVGSKVTTYGITTLPSGTTITPGASGAEGAYAQLTASSTFNHFAFVPSFQLANDTTTNSLLYQVDLGVGAATEALVAEWWYSADSNETMEGPLNNMPVYYDVPSGTRLAMRASCSGAIDAGYSGVIHALS